MLPRGEKCKRTLRYQRPSPPVPQTFKDINLSEEYTHTTNNLQFLQYDCGTDSQKYITCLLYARQSTKTSKCSYVLHGWYTFSVAPHPFKLLYTIRTGIPLRDGTVNITVVYVL